MQPGTEHLTDAQREQLEAAERLFADAAIECDPSQVEELLGQGAQLVDVREPYEFSAGHIPGARSIELERLGWNSPTLDPTRPVLFYCRLGIRAKLAAHAFRRIGIEAFSITGGFARWHAERRPVDPADGTVADH